MEPARRSPESDLLDRSRALIAQARDLQDRLRATLVQSAVRAESTPRFIGAIGALHAQMMLSTTDAVVRSADLVEKTWALAIRHLDAVDYEARRPKSVVPDRHPSI